MERGHRTISNRGYRSWLAPTSTNTHAINKVNFTNIIKIDIDNNGDVDHAPSGPCHESFGFMERRLISHVTRKNAWDQQNKLVAGEVVIQQTIQVLDAEDWLVWFVRD